MASGRKEVFVGVYKNSVKYDVLIMLILAIFMLTMSALVIFVFFLMQCLVQCIKNNMNYIILR